MNIFKRVLRLNILIIVAVLLLYFVYTQEEFDYNLYSSNYIYAQDQILGVTSDEELAQNINEDSSLEVVQSNSVLDFELNDNQIEKINNEQNIKLSSGYKITIDDQYVIYTSDIKYFNEAIDNILRVSLSDAAYETYKLNGEIPPFVKDDKYYVEFYMSSNVDVEKGEFNEELFLNSTDAVQYFLINGNSVPKYETVTESNTIEDIMSSNDLTEAELYLNNPGISKDTLLSSGEQIVVNQPDYHISFTGRYESEVNREIEYQTFNQPNPDLLLNEQKVTQQGENGTEMLNYSNTEINGTLTSQTLMNNMIISQPTNEIVEVGTKELPDVGTGTFIWPEDCKTITNGYLGYYEHRAIDIQCTYGGPIYAIDNGVVEVSEFMAGGYGNYVVINHNNGYKSLYGHMAQTPLVNVGDVVYQGQVIGYEGSTGNSTGHHLHLEIQLTDSTNQNVISKPNPCDYYDYC